MRIGKIVLVHILILVYGFTKAQLYIGAEAGYSTNCSNADISRAMFTNSKNGGGYAAGLVAKYDFQRRLSIESGIFLLQKNYSFIRTGEYTGVYTRFKNTYIQVPIILEIKLLSRKKTEAYLSAGGFGGYWAFGRVNGAAPNIFGSYEIGTSNRGLSSQFLSLTKYSEKYQFDSHRDNRVELGWLLGLGTKFTFKEKYFAFIQCNFYGSLTSQQKKYMLFQKNKNNHTVSVSLGIMCSIKGKKK